MIRTVAEPSDAHLAAPTQPGERDVVGFLVLRHLRERAVRLPLFAPLGSHRDIMAEPALTGCGPLAESHLGQVRKCVPVLHLLDLSVGRARIRMSVVVPRSSGSCLVGRNVTRQDGRMGSPGRQGRTAFVCAMPMELKPLVKRLSLRKTTIGGVPVHSGLLDGREVLAIVTGMGTQLARQGLQRLLDGVVIDRVVVVGITGALENETPIGTLVVPEVVVDSASGAEHRPAQLGDIEPRGKMWTTDSITTDPGVLDRLRGEGVVSLDMETAAIAEVCEERGIPWSVFRVISDRATDGSIDEEVFHLSNQDGTPNGAAVARFFLKHPDRVAQMARLAKGSKLATETAADAAVRACALG